ncbi:AAA family ATPase [Dermacoccaceae bacterium W4C1]
MSSPPVRILLTGMSGVGKSTVLDELIARGHRGVELDADGWSTWTTRAGDLEQSVDEARLDSLLDRHDGGLLVVAGTWSGMRRYLPGTPEPSFDLVVLLSLPPAELFSRLAVRSTNPCGTTPAERAKVQRDLESIEPLLRSIADAEIDTRTPIPHIADTMEDLAQELLDPR